jgi:hypothetical protein
MDKNSELVSLSHLVLTTFGFSFFVSNHRTPTPFIFVSLRLPSLSLSKSFVYFLLYSTS